MANREVVYEEGNLQPAEVEQIDYRRQMGLVFQVISGQMTIISVLLTWWIGQDLTYANPHGHIIAYYFCITAICAVVFGIVGTAMRRGTPRLD